MSNIFASLVNEKDLTTSGSGIKFGINPLTVKEIKVEDGEFNGNKTLQMILEFDVSGSKNMMFLSLLPGALFFGGKQVQKGDPDYTKAETEFYTQAMGTVVHILKAFGVTEEDLAKAIETKKPKDIKTWLKAVITLLPKNYKEIKLDGFFMWQWMIKGTNTRTFLELGPNMKKGYFLSPHVEPVGEWTEVVDGNNHYWEDEAGNRHPIFKSKYIMESACAKMQGTTDTSASTKESSEGVFSSDADDLPFPTDEDEGDSFVFS